MWSAGPGSTPQRIKPLSGGSFEVEKSAIKSAAVARSIYTTLRADHLERIVMFTEIDGMISGNPPYDPEELLQQALSHIANFNTQEAKSFYKKAAQAYWNLLYTSESVIDIHMCVRDPMSVDIGYALSRNWNETVREMWPSFDTNVATLCGDIVKFGHSPVVWSDSSSPFWQVVDVSKFFVPNQSQSDFDMLTNICIETELPITYFLAVWEQYRKHTPSEEHNWNIEFLEQFLAMKANQPVRGTTDVTDLLTLQQRLIQGDYNYQDLYNESVRIVYLYYKEGDGSISEFMILRDLDSGYSGTGYSDNFLFKHESKYKSFDEFLLLFTMCP